MLENTSWIFIEFSIVECVIVKIIMNATRCCDLLQEKEQPQPDWFTSTINYSICDFFLSQKVTCWISKIKLLQLPENWMKTLVSSFTVHVVLIINFRDSCRVSK